MLSTCLKGWFGLQIGDKKRVLRVKILFDLMFSMHIVRYIYVSGIAMIGNRYIADSAVTYVPKKGQLLGARRRGNPSVGFSQFPSDALPNLLWRTQSPFEK